MKQLVNLFGRHAKNQVTSARRPPSRRALRSEALEQRQLLAGDLLIAHNYTLPEDVNGDWRVTPLDALIILNHISRNGNSLEGFQAGDLENFVDVTGNNEVTPLDALKVMNHLARGEAQNEVLQLHINPRTADDQPVSATAFNAATRQLTVGVNEIFNLEVLYTDLRASFDRLGAFAIFSDVLFDPAGGGVLEPVLTETQFLQISANLREADGGTITFGLEQDPDDPVEFDPFIVDFEDFAESQDAPAIKIREALESFGFQQVSVQSLPTTPGEPFDFLIRFKDFALADQDLPNLAVTMNLVDTQGAPLDVTANVTDVKPRNEDGTINNSAVPLNLDFDSRTLREPRDQRTGETFFGFAGTQVGSFSAASGFIDVGATGPLLVNGFPDMGLGALPRPFDAFSIPVRLTQEVENLRIFLDPPNTSATANLLYGRETPVPNDLLRIDLVNSVGELNPDTTTDGTGVLFVTAVVPEEVIVTAANGTLSAQQGGNPVTIDLQNLVTVQGSDADPVITLATQPAFGSVGVDANGVATYTPPADQSGTTSFTYTATVGDVSATGTITVTVGAAQEVTIEAGDGTLDAQQNGPAVSIDVAPLVTVTGTTATPTFAIDAEPTRGTVSIVGSTITYTPAAGEVGTDSFTYRATVNGESDTGTITVNIAPEQVVVVNAGDGTLNAQQNGPAVSLNLAPLVTVTGSTATPTFTIDSEPTRGTVTISGSTVIYTPAAGEVGADSFTYRATVNGESDTGTISVNIAPEQVVVNAGDGTLNAQQNGPAVSLNLAPLVTVTGSTATPTFTIDSEPTRGTVTISGSTATYTPTAGEVGADSFTYRATVNGVSDTGTISVNIAAEQVVVNAPNGTISAGPGTATGSFTPAVEVTGSTAQPVLAIETAPTKGTVAISNGTLVYTPTAGQVGADSFVYRATVDGVSDTGTVAVNIVTEQVTVTAANGTLAAEEDGGPRTLNLAPLVTVTGSTTAPVFAIVTPPTRGTATISGSTLTYTPNPNTFGTDTLVYRATVNGVSDTGTITINVAPIEAPPVARDVNFNVTADTTATFTSAQLTANDSPARPNISGLPPRVISAEAISGTTQGTVSFNATTGNVTYTPPAGFTGEDSFRYTITSEGQTASAIVRLNVREFAPSRVTGMIFNDFVQRDTMTRNQLRDDNEPGIGGARVVLTSPAADNVLNENINVTVLTDAQGNYRLEGLAPGRYTVTYDKPDFIVFGQRVNRSGHPVGGSGTSFIIDIPEEGGRNFDGLNFTVHGKTGVAHGISTLLVSQYEQQNDPNFGSAVMVLDTGGSQELFEVGRGFEDVLFAEVAVGQSGDSAILTVITLDGTANSTILGKDDFRVSNGGQVVQVTRSISSMTFLNTPEEVLRQEFGDYRQAVDQVLASGLF